MKPLNVCLCVIASAAFAAAHLGPNAAGASSLQQYVFGAEDRKVTWPDTQENWDYFVTDVKQFVADETHGVEPPLTGYSWREYWATAIYVREKFQENYGKYVGHIFETRTNAGLPPLPDDLSRYERDDVSPDLRDPTVEEGEVPNENPQIFEMVSVSIDLHVEDEKNGKSPALNLESWEKFWAQRIYYANQTANPELYIEYIVRSRKRAGLPDLPSEVIQ